MLNKSELPEVSSDKLYLNSTNTKLNQEGLLSEVYFGPRKSYNCSCGNLSIKTLHEGVTCNICGVKSEPNSVRYTKFAKITLPFFIINTLKKQKFYKITKKEFKSLLNPTQYDLVASINIYLEYNSVTDSLNLTNTYTFLCLPIKITGLYTLFLAINAVAIVFNSLTAKNYLDDFYNEILVLPPECRLVLNITDTSRTIIKHKIVDIYRNMIWTKNCILKDNLTISEDFTSYLNLLTTKITQGDTTFIEDKKLFSYDEIVSKFQYYSDVLYEEVLILLSGKKGIIRSDFLGKSIDFSSRAIVINDPSLAAHQIKIAKETFFKLWIIEYIIFCQKQNFQLNKLIYENFEKILKPIKNSDVNIDFSLYPNFEEFIDWTFNQASREQRLLYINRQPTLWRYGLLGVEVVGLNEDKVTSVSPLIISSLAMDFDGDTAALYKVHDHRCIDELYNNSFVMNLITYDHNDSFLIEISNEAKYAFEILKSSYIDDKYELISIDKLSHLYYDYKININSKVHIRDINVYTSYGIALLNKFANFKLILITETTSNNELLQLIYNNSVNNEQYQTLVKSFISSIQWFLSTYSLETLSLPFKESINLIEQTNNNDLLSKLPNNPYLGSYIYYSIAENIYSNLPKHYQLYKLTKSKFRKNSFFRGLITIGYIADNHNMISPVPVKSNILSGLTEDEFFETSFGTRKGLIDKDKNVPNAGYMQRSMVINLSTLEIVEDDCNTTVGFRITIQNQTHNRSMLNRYFVNEYGHTVLYDESYAKDINNVGKTFVFRSPITCQTPNFRVCAKCTGKQKFNSPFIGVMTGQYIEERLTQLTMSSFHTSGSATIRLNPDILKYFQNNLKDIINESPNIIVKFKDKIDDSFIEFISNNPQFKFIKQISETELLFEEYSQKIENEDVGIIIKKVNSILETQIKSNLIPLHDAYYELINALHQVSSTYSIFIELLLANVYVNKNNKIIRYALKDKEDTNIVKKYNTKSIHQLLSNTLSLIYEPNKQSILNYYEEIEMKNKNIKDLSIFERIWYYKI